MTDVFRLLSAAPQATRLLSVAQRAANGDPQALEVLRREGWADLLDVLVRPGAGQSAREALQHAKTALHTVQKIRTGEYVDAEYRVLDSTPWGPFLTWIKRQRWGTFVILGPKGQGKSTLALRLAQVWHGETGWPVEVVNLYPEDRYPFTTAVSVKQFSNRIKSIIDLLNPPEPEEGEPAKELTPEQIDRALRQHKKRIVVIDEASLTVGVSGQDAGRLLVRQIMAQARHLDWLIIYVGQLARMLPTDLLNCEAVFIKKPNGREALTDRDDRLTQDLWTRAIEAFDTVQQSPWYIDEFADMRAWAYVDCHDLGDGREFLGMMPFSPPFSQQSEDKIEEGEFDER